MSNPEIRDILSTPNINRIPKYWESLKPLHNVDAALEDAWKKKVEFMDEVSLQNNVVVFLWNIFTNRFLYMSDKLKVLSGLDPALFLAENGVAYSFSLIHPDHLQPGLLLNQKFLNYCSDNNIHDYRSVSLCLNYLYKNGLGEYVQILQRGVILEVDENGKPSLCLSFTYYVGHIKKPFSIGGVFVGPEEVLIFDYDNEKKALMPAKKFSEQEMKILRLLGAGLDTKAIAKKLVISPHTVDTHRRNLIRKTGCIDTTGVVTFARMISII